MFSIGDSVVHPIHGAGTVIDMKERRTLGSGKRYYSIELVSQPNTVVMVPVQSAEDIGLRHSIGDAQLSRVWRVLRAAPDELPACAR